MSDFCVRVLFKTSLVWFRMTVCAINRAQLPQHSSDCDSFLTLSCVYNISGVLRRLEAHMEWYIELPLQNAL